MVSRRTSTQGAGLVEVDCWGRGSAVTSQVGYSALSALCGGNHLIPATARSPRQFDRIRWPSRKPPIAVLLNGGLILKHGSVDTGWLTAARRRVENSGWRVSRAEAIVRGFLPAESRVVDVAPAHFLAVVCPTRPDSQQVQGLRAAAQDSNMTCSVQGAKVYLSPNSLGKAEALEWISFSLGLQISATAGDSALDERMLSLAEDAACPHGSEVHRREGVRLTFVAHGEPVQQVARIAVWLAERAGLGNDLRGHHE